MPKAKRLQDWYIKMLDRAKESHAIVDYQDLNDYIQRNNIARARDVNFRLLISLLSIFPLSSPIRPLLFPSLFPASDSLLFFYIYVCFLRLIA